MSTVFQKFKFTLNDIPTYRSELMGWSILWIMALHFRFITIKPLGFIAQYGFSGVEIFMFVSGLGLYYSLQKRPSLPTFYRKRLFRIFPTYYLVGVIASLVLFGDNLQTYLFRYSTIGFWTGGPYFEWYIPSIVACYLAAPFLKKLLDSRWSFSLGILVICMLASSYVMVWHPVFDRSHFFCYYRIPAFVTGMACAKWLLEGKSQTPSIKYGYWGVAIAGMIVFAFCFPFHYVVYEFKYYSLFFLMPIFIAFFCTVGKVSKALNVVFRSMGNASLEIYLIQCLFFTAINNGQLTVSDTWHDDITLSLIAGCSVAGILLHLFLERLWSLSRHANRNTGV